MGKVAKYSHFRPHTTCSPPLPPAPFFDPSKIKHPSRTYQPRHPPCFYRSLPFTCWHLFSISWISLLRVTIMRRLLWSLASKGNRTLSREPYRIPDRFDRPVSDSEKWRRRGGVKAKSWHGMFFFGRRILRNDFLMSVKLTLFFFKFLFFIV